MPALYFYKNFEGAPDGLVDLADDPQASYQVWKIGRHSDNDIVILDKRISRYCVIISHRLIRNPNGGWSDYFYLEDLSSHNGIWLNGVKLAPNDPSPLRPTDKICFGWADAKAAFEAAYLLVPTDSKGQKELSELLSEASKKLIVEQKREKNVWQKAFKKGSKGEGDLYTSKKDDDSQVTNGSSSPETAAPTKIDPKNKDVSKENQLWKAENFFSGHMFGSFVFMGVLGLLGTAAYWWSRRRR